MSAIELSKPWIEDELDWTLLPHSYQRISILEPVAGVVLLRLVEGPDECVGKVYRAIIDRTPYEPEMGDKHP